MNTVLVMDDWIIWIDDKVVDVYRSRYLPVEWSWRLLFFDR